MSLAMAAARPGRPGWLRSPSFDLIFILGLPALALGAGAVVIAQPALFLPVLLLDLWVLGYHHVVSTWTRLCFDGASFARHRFLILWLPLIVLAAVSALVLGLGAWTVATIYFYWQWFHYARQSWGISQAYRRASLPVTLPEPSWLLTAVTYLVPLWGILHRSGQGPAEFLGMELAVLPVPALAVEAVRALALAALAAWAVFRASAALRGALPVAHTLYMASHFVIFVVAYVLIADLTVGWLVINTWHNAQYVLFVWLQNNRRFEGKAEPGARLLSFISQRRNVFLYFGLCLALSSTLYAAIQSGLTLLNLPAITAAAIVYQTINFHHYIIDALIWRSPKPRATPAA